MHTKSVMGWCVGGLALLGCAGCGVGIAGKWSMVRATPNKDVFAMDAVTFGGDGSYSATTTIEGKTNQEVGSYSYNGWQLSMRPQAGGQRTYSASMWFSDLRVTDSKDRVVVLHKTQ